MRLSLRLLADIDHIDRTFGFDSAVEEAQTAIRSAKTEAVCNLPNGAFLPFLFYPCTMKCKLKITLEITNKHFAPNTITLTRKFKKKSTTIISHAIVFVR